MLKALILLLCIILGVVELIGNSTYTLFPIKSHYKNNDTDKHKKLLKVIIFIFAQSRNFYANLQTGFVGRFKEKSRKL